MPGKVVVVGSSNTDMVLRTEKLPGPGETVLGDDLIVAGGGKGANQAVAAARLGASVTFVTRVGSDSFGDDAVEHFKEEGLGLEFLIRDEDHPSGVALILVDSKGENMIGVASGANRRLSPADVEKAWSAIENASVVLLQLECPIESVLQAAELGSKAGARVILNPAPAQELGDDLLSCVTTITPNAGEAYLLTGVFPEDAKSAEEAAERLLARGVREVIITLGEKGAFLATSEFSELIPALKVESVDTTAAGDSFNGALACALGDGQGLKEAVEFAVRAAAITVTRVGAQPSLPVREEVS